MKSISTLFRQLFLIVALISVFSLSAWGEEKTATLTFDNTNKRTSFSTTQQVWTENGITFTNNKASSSTSVANYSNPVRLYAGSNVVIEAPGNITKIVFDCNSSSYATAMKNSIGSSATASSDKVTVTLNGTTNSFTVAKLTAQVRLDNLTVTYVAPTNPTLEIESTSIDFGEIEQNTTQTKTFTIEGSNLTSDVTLSINGVDFTLDKTSITPTDGNVDETITITLNTQNIGEKSGTITVSNNEVVDQTISLSANVIAPKQKFDVHFWHNGEIVKTIQVSEGESLGEFPIIDNLESCNSNLPTFAGWVTDYVGYENIENTTQPTFFVPTQPINGETNLYAVFADASSESTWNLVKNISELTNGSKVIIACPTKNVAAGTQNGTYRDSTSITLSNEQITDLKSAKIFTLGNTSSGYSFYSDDEKHYVVLTSSANALHTATSLSDSETSYWNITISNNVTSITNKKHTTRKLQYNASSPRFACYESNQTAIALYKKTSAQATKWTVCTPNDAPELTKLAQPQNLTITATENSITAKWNAVNNASGYIVSINDENPQEIGNNTITISELIPETEYSISVVAKGDNINFKNSDATNASISTLSITVENINAFIEKANKENNVTISGEVVVTAISEKKDVIWIEDNSGAIMVYDVSNKSNYKVGDAFSGVKGLYEIYNGLPEIKNPIFPNEKTEAKTPAPEMITISDINDTWLNKLVKIENVIYTKTVTNNNSITTRTFTDANDETIDSYDSHFSAQDININDKVNLTAVVGKYNTNYQLYIISAERVKEPTISVSDSELDFGDVVENKELSKSTTITTVDLGESASVSISGTNASCFAVNTNTIEDNSETEITITFTAPDVDVEIECTATLTITGGGQTKEIALSATVKPLLTLTANINGETIAVGSFAEGDDITTALNAIDVTAPEGWSFAGWVANAIDGSQTATPEYLTIMPAKATIAYAVFKLGKEQIFTETLSASTANYTGSKGYCDFTATSASGTWTGKACYNTSYYLQINKDSKNYHIGSPIFTGNVTSLKITTTNNSAANRTFYICSSNSTAQPTSGDLGQHTTTTANEEFTIDLTKEAKQFYIYSSGAVYISKIEITYIEASDILYRTSVSSLVVTNDDTETISEDINSLTLHVDKTPNTQLEVTETITADKVTVIQTINASRWFFFSLPFDCNVADIVATYVNGGAELEYAPDASTGDYVITEYNGGWVELIGTSHTLNANQGYIIGHFGSGDVTVKFPSNGAQNISAPANATLAKTSDNGFNLIGLPYFQKVTNANLNVTHVSIPNDDGKTYKQEVCDADIIATIAPFTSFFVQTKAENIEFTIAAQQNAAPMMRANGITNKAVITLTDANGGADKTTIINDPSKTTDYEIGHDLTKLIGYASIPQIYSLQGDEMLAFNSLAIDNSTVIPLGVYAYADGDYTFALSEKSLGNLEGWELYDNETGKTTRLANKNLTIYLEQGTHEGRFEIRLQQRVPTVCDNTMGDMMTWTANGTLNISNMPTDAVVYIYDAVGRMVHVATPNTNTFNYDFVARGVYNIVVRTADNTISFKTIY